MDEFVEKAAQRPLDSMTELSEMLCVENDEFAAGNENEPPGPEKLALGNVKRGAFWARVNGNDSVDDDDEVELRNVGDGNEIVVSGDWSAARSAEGSEDDEDA